MTVPRESNDDDFDVNIDDIPPDDDDVDDDDNQPSSEEFERMRRALTKANREAKKHRLRYKQLVKGGKNDDKDDDKKNDVDRERIRDEVSEAEEARWKKRVVRQAAKAALLEAGLLGDATKLARLIDEDDVDVDEDGEITDGLEEQIEDIRNDYPDLFEDRTKERKSSRGGLRGIDGGDRSKHAPQRKLSSAEKIQQLALTGGKRRR